MLVGELVEGDMSDMGHIGATCEIDTGKGFVWLLMDECSEWIVILWSFSIKIPSGV